MKTCTKCHESKSESEFYKNAKSKTGGLRSYCKSCGLEMALRYRHSHPEMNAAKCRRWRAANLDKARESERKWRAANSKRLYRANLDKEMARTAVSNAAQAGRIPRAKDLCCALCGQPACEYHHHNGYSQPHRLDVIPLCKTCHKHEHANRPSSSNQLLRLTGG